MFAGKLSRDAVLKELQQSLNAEPGGEEVPPAEYFSQGAHSERQSLALSGTRIHEPVTAEGDASGAIAGTAVVAAVVLLVLATLAWLAYRRYRRQVYPRSPKGRIDMRVIR